MFFVKVCYNYKIVYGPNKKKKPEKLIFRKKNKQSSDIIETHEEDGINKNGEKLIEF